jgi:bifunctional non-homologous end joining protein LigD
VRSPFKGPTAPRKGPEVYWVKPSLVAEVEFAGWTQDGMRVDKPAAEVRAELPARAK